MHNYWLYIALAFGGHIFYLCKQLLENIKRKEKFNKEVFLISEAMNIMAIFLLVYLAIEAPTAWLTMSPITAILIGAFGSSMLSALINTKKPKEDGGDSFSQPAAPNDNEISNK